MSVTQLPSQPTSHLGDAADTRAETGGLPSATKALQLLEVFREHGPTLGVSEAARLAGVPKSTAFRLLQHLEDGGYLERDGRLYILGRRLFELGNSVPMCRPHGIRDVALPHLADLFAATGKTVHLGVLDGTDVVYVEKIAGGDSVQVETAVGGRMPASCSALGKAMLAFSDRSVINRVLTEGLVRRTRYSIADPARFLAELRRVNFDRLAVDREEVRLGLVCVSAPILSEGRSIAAVSVSCHATRFNAAQLGGRVQRTTAAISAALQQTAA